MAKLALTHTSLHGDSVPLYNGNAQADAHNVFITFSQSRCVYNKHLDKARTLISTLNCCHLSYDKPNPWREIIITTSQQKEHGATEA